MKHPTTPPTVKAQIVFPEDLLLALDGVAGSRKRSEFVVDATREKLARVRFQEALKTAAGAWTAKDHPETRDRTSLDRWLRKARTRSRRRTP